MPADITVELILKYMVLNNIWPSCIMILKPQPLLLYCTFHY
jgi:hypothetical protein